MTKIYWIALLFAPLALLSACGSSSTGSSSSQDSSGSGSLDQPLYVYAPTGGGWTGGSDTPAPPSSPADVPAATAVHNYSPTTISSPTSRLTQYCVIHRCSLVPQHLVARDWPIHIPVPMPDPAPRVGSQIIYANKVFSVTGYSSVSRAPTLVIEQTHALVGH